MKQVIEYQFELEVVCKKRELLLIDSRLRNAETMLKQMSDDSPSQPPLVADEPQETEADFDDEKTKATQPILYARRKDGQYVRLVCSDSRHLFLFSSNMFAGSFSACPSPRLVYFSIHTPCLSPDCLCL